MSNYKKTIFRESVMQDIKHLASQFRNAVNAAKDAGEFDKDTSFRNFPQGCCGDTSDLLAQFLLENGIRTYYVYGTYRAGVFDEIQTHAWLFTGNHIIIDITGDQFRYNPIFLNYNNPVYVGMEDVFHKMFEVEKRNIRANSGLEALGHNCQPRLKGLYQKIVGYL